MPVKILMPALSPTMTEGNLVRWLKSEGDIVKSGQVLAEIETDKATMEVEAVEEGTLAKIMVAAGTEGVKVNSLIAVLLEEGEDATSIDAFISTADLVAPAQPTAPTLASKSTSVSSAATSASLTTGERLFVSPLAKRVAAQNQINLASITGSGPRGRIVKADVEHAALAPSKNTSAPGQATVYGDSGYGGLPKREEIKSDQDKSQIDYRINIKPSLQLTKSSFNGYNWEKSIEHRKSATRCKVEHIFLIVKRQFGYSKVVYRGIAKNFNRFYVLFASTNIVMCLRAKRSEEFALG